MYYSVCLDNTDLIRINPIDVDWETTFLNLYFDRSKAKEIGFADNGRHWQYNDTDYSFNTVNMNVYLDDNDHISGIDFYKYKTTSFNHGKNSSRELSVSASDRKAYLAVLQKVIVDTSEDEVDRLISAVEQSEFGKERQLQVKKNDISLLDQNGVRQTIKRKTILKAVQISHVYLEVILNDRVFNLYPKDFPPEICSVLHEILSFVDIDQYYCVDDLRYDMSIRELFETADEKYPLLRQAVIDGDIDKVRELAPYAMLVPEDNSEGSPLIHAVMENRTDILKILLENGAYTIEMERDGSRYPLEMAYKNGNRDIVRLLLAYHGAKSKIYGAFKHNTDNLLKMCAANKDYEVLELMAPEAYTADKGTWLTPELFPDMEDETIDALSKCKGIKMVWTLDQIKPIYEKKEYEMCKRMLQQGSTKEVIDYFAAQDDCEMFEASLQCHSSIHLSRETYIHVYEHGRKWFDVLSKHDPQLLQNEYSYFESILNSGDIDRYNQIIKQRGCSYRGFAGFMIRPEIIKEPEKYIELLREVIRIGEPCKYRRLFLEDIVRHFGDEQLAKDYFKKYPLYAEIDWRSFRENHLIPNYIRRTENPYAGAELIRSFFSQDVEDKVKKAFQLVTDLINEFRTVKDIEPVEDESGLSQKELCALYMLRALLSCVDMHEIDEQFAQMYGKRGITSAYDFGFLNGKSAIRSKPFVELLKNGK